VRPDSKLLLWILGDSLIHWGKLRFLDRREQLDVSTLREKVITEFIPIRGLTFKKTFERLVQELDRRAVVPNILIIHVGTNDLSSDNVLNLCIEAVRLASDIAQECTERAHKSSVDFKMLLWSDIIERIAYDKIGREQGDAIIQAVNGSVHACALKSRHYFIKHELINRSNRELYHYAENPSDKVHLSVKGSEQLLIDFDDAITNRFFPKVMIDRMNRIWQRTKQK
jgi:hypothetical protein